MIQVSNALTHGLKQRKRYLWYGVWDIWRRLLFIVANLFLSVSTFTVLVSNSPEQQNKGLFCTYLVQYLHYYSELYIRCGNRNMMRCNCFILQFVDCVFIMVCLFVICLVQPYKKYHINFMESVIILCLFGATLAILDNEDIYVGPITSACFIALPYLYAIVFILYRGIKNLGSFGW